MKIIKRWTEHVEVEMDQGEGLFVAGIEIYRVPAEEKANVHITIREVAK